MKKLSLLLILFLIPFVQAVTYTAPTDSFTLNFTAYSIELGVLDDGDDLGNTTAILYVHEIYDIRLSFHINNSQDLDMSNLVIRAEDDKTFVHGMDQKYTVYLPNNNEDKGVFICPNINSLDEIKSNCPGKIELIGGELGQISLGKLDNLYSVKGLEFESVGVGLITESIQPENKLPEILSSPENNYKTTGSVLFRCEASDEEGLKQIELYTNISGSFERTTNKPTSEISDLLEFSASLNPGIYEWRCRVIDNIDQVTQSDIRTLIVEETNSKEPCIENWIASPWLPLECETEQTRIVTDQNNCGTEINKPKTRRSCEEICREKWSCSDWSENSCGFRTCKDLNQCNNVENIIEKPEEVKSCIQQTQDNTLFIETGVFVVFIVLVILAIFLKKRRQENIYENIY